MKSRVADTMSLQFLQVLDELRLEQRIIEHLHPQAHARDGGLEVVGHGGEDAGALLDVAGQSRLHGVECLRGAAHFQRSLHHQWRTVDVLAQGLGGQRHVLQRAGDPAHRDQRQQDHRDEQDDQFGKQRIQGSVDVIGEIRLERDPAVVFETHLDEEDGAVGGLLVRHHRHRPALAQEVPQHLLECLGRVVFSRDTQAGAGGPGSALETSTEKALRDDTTLARSSGLRALSTVTMSEIRRAVSMVRV